MAPIRMYLDIFCRIEDLSNTIHSDQTGSSPYPSQHDNRYIMVAIHLDMNYIFVEPMKTRTGEVMMRAYQKIVDRIPVAGLGLKRHILNNKASKAFKEKIQENGMQYKLIPPRNHQQNQAKWEIQTFKAHFISILVASTINSHYGSGVIIWSQWSLP